MSNIAQGAIILGIGISILILCIIGLFKTNLVRNLHSRSWPIANGAVTSTNVRRKHGKLYEPNVISEIAYSYQLNEKYYSGYFHRRFYRERAAWDFVDRTKNQPVFVSYKASQPEVSVLRLADRRMVSIS